ncbi:MAG: CPBP family intramembrane glutamic endopeptidase [Acidimicrobiia bacterium]
MQEPPPPPLPPQPPPSGPVSFVGAVPPPPRRVWWGIGDFIWISVAGFLAAVVASVAYAVVLTLQLGRAPTADDLKGAVWLITITLVMQNGVIIAGTVLVSRWKGRGSLADFGWQWRVPARNLLWVLVGAGLQFVLNLVLIPLSLLLNGDQQQTVVEALKSSVSFGLVVALLGVVLVAPFTEELLFRGVLLRSLQRRLRPGPAVAISAVVFAAVHVLGDPSVGSTVALPALFAVGVICGMRAVRTGSIQQSVCIHVGFNLWTAIALLVAAATR